jgi:hypothetical protein
MIETAETFFRVIVDDADGDDVNEAKIEAAIAAERASGRAGPLTEVIPVIRQIVESPRSARRAKPILEKETA